jgi:hypothetical protein
MITLLSCDIRRMLRRRLSILLLAVPLLLIICTAVAAWLGRPLPGLLGIGVILGVSIILFAQFLISDREGEFEQAIVTSPVPRWLLLARRVLLLALPFCIQMALYRAIVSLLK